MHFPPNDESEDFMRGVASVVLIRCVEHRAIPPYNRNEASGGECAACEVEAARAVTTATMVDVNSLRAEVERLRKETR